MAVLLNGILTYIFFYLSNLTIFINWFIFILLLAITSRILLTFYVSRCDEKHLKLFANGYVIASLVLSLDFSILSLTYYDLKIFELRYFLILVHIGLITSAIITLSVWFNAYIFFAIPQLLALTTIFILDGSILVALITVVFSVFILTVAKKYNTSFNEGKLLIEKNKELINNMATEINNRKDAQDELEEHKQKLEDIVESRTSELKETNNDLLEQIKIRQDIEKELEHLAYYEDLTALPNRSLFIDNLKKALAQAKRNESLLGVLFIDLDRFKNINDSHGHYIGDGLLKAVAERLTNALRDSDTIARNGSDEFVVVIENMKDVREPYIVANKVIECLNQKLNINGHDIHIVASVGISMYPLDGDDALELLKMSDTA